MTCTERVSLIFTILFLLSFNSLSHNRFNSAKTTYAQRFFFFYFVTALFTQQLLDHCAAVNNIALVRGSTHIFTILIKFIFHYLNTAHFKK